MRGIVFNTSQEAEDLQSSLTNLLGYPDNLTNRYTDIIENSAYPNKFILIIQPCYSPETNTVINIEDDLLTTEQKALVQNLTLTS